MSTWTPVCDLSALDPERGVAALVDGVQVALFLLDDGRVLGVANHDPFSGANVVSRGIVGSRGERTTVTSPMHKQVWDLVTGECLDAAGKEPVDLPAFPVEVRDGVVHVGS
ncbi:nitrite reductase small subunit NirD [Sanguibacter sp. HDW7]|uniref:nitrite reductase small subunit NirD n=1 Tax=Sanguibacter sp. HDW7 TaxID=2714931 RepID=UPI001409DE5E|nr:nitrite reductase small subunit NirD [Sanguibacter sp. HDW7]QIK84530.1 nitrite reductase small subunit NirD [Sanguibacter sp. HDW7]